MKKEEKHAIIDRKEGIIMNILILDDEKEIADLVEVYLKLFFYFSLCYLCYL